MKKTMLLIAIAVLAGPALADQPQMTEEQMAEMQAYMEAGTPGAPHSALAETVGTYDLDIKSWHDPAGPAMESKGEATRKMILQGRVLVEEMESSMMGMPFTGRGMQGYDNVTGKYWSTWMDSMSTGLMVSEGDCNGSMSSCTFVGSWNDPIKKTPVKARMVITKTGSGKEMFEMYGPNPKTGKEMKMMEITYTKR